MKLDLKINLISHNVCLLIRMCLYCTVSLLYLTQSALTVPIECPWLSVPVLDEW